MILPPKISHYMTSRNRRVYLNITEIASLILMSHFAELIWPYYQLSAVTGCWINREYTNEALGTVYPNMVKNYLGMVSLVNWFLCTFYYGFCIAYSVYM